MILLPLAAAVAAWMLTAAVRQVALSRSIVDVPNSRSSHETPTPRGGGLAIVLTSLAGLVALGSSGLLSWRLVLAIAPASAVVAAIGFVDDLRGVSARVRVTVHFAAAGWVVYWLEGLPFLNLGVRTLHLGPAGALIGVLLIAWAANLYNFMDGIDGLAGGEAVLVGLFGAVMLFVHGQQGLAQFALVVTAASAGFLVWNWAPARIFMGDVGSGFLGFTFGSLALASERVGGPPILAWVLLLGAFVFDATVTLARRFAHGERWHEAHRSHAYQRAIRAGLTHAQVTGVVLATDVALGILALFGALKPGWLLFAVVTGLALLLPLYLRVERVNPMWLPMQRSRD